LVSANVLIGKKIVGTNGDSVGEVKDVELDMTTMKIIYMLVKLSDKAAAELGYTKTSGSLGRLSLTEGSKNVFMPVELISSISDVITVKNTLLEMAEGHLLKKYSE